PPNCSTPPPWWPTPTQECRPTRGRGAGCAATAANSRSRRSRSTICTTSCTTHTTSVVDRLKTVANEGEFVGAVSRQGFHLTRRRAGPHRMRQPRRHQPEPIEFYCRPRLLVVGTMSFRGPAHGERPVRQVLRGCGCRPQSLRDCAPAR